MIFPSDALSVQHELLGPSSYTFVNNTNVKYILGVSIQQSGVASQTNIKCGTTVVAINYGKDFPYNNLMYRCSAAITGDKTGNDNSSILITYVQRDLSLEPPIIASVSSEFGPRTNAAMHDLSYIVWMSAVMTMISLGIITFLIFMKRK